MTLPECEILFTSDVYQFKLNLPEKFASLS